MRRPQRREELHVLEPRTGRVIAGFEVTARDQTSHAVGHNRHFGVGAVHGDGRIYLVSENARRQGVVLAPVVRTDEQCGFWAGLVETARAQVPDERAVLLRDRETADDVGGLQLRFEELVHLLVLGPEQIADRPRPHDFVAEFQHRPHDPRKQHDDMRHSAIPFFGLLVRPASRFSQ